MDPVTDYAKDVVAGRIITGELVRLACQRHLKDLKTGKARGLVWDPQAAQLAFAFFKLLRHSKGPTAGKPFLLEAWQQFFVGSIYGWKKRDGTRRFKFAHLEVARKNGKTTIASGIGLAELVLTGEQGAEVYTVATKRDQARITHKESLRMVAKSPSLKKRLTVYKDAITFDATASTYIPLTSEGDSHDGLNPSCAVLDEIHAWKDRLLYDVIETAIDARAQPLILITTTAGSDKHSIWWERRELAIKVLKGLVEDDEVFAYIATLDEGDEWTDPAVWIKANPNLGITIAVDTFAKRVKQAQQIPGKQNSFKRLRLNVPTGSATIWIPQELWVSMGGLTKVDRLVHKPCFTAIDLSEIRDLTAAMHVFPPEEDRGLWSIIPRFWLPEDDLEERSNADGFDYVKAAEEGFIRLIPGRIIDDDVVREDLMEDAEELQITAFVFDPWKAGKFATRIQNDGHTVIPFKQSYKNYDPAVNAFERLCIKRRILHTGCPVLAWCFENVSIVEDTSGNRKPSKKHSKGRIDGVVAAVMGVGGALFGEVDEGQESLEL